MRRETRRRSVGWLIERCPESFVAHMVGKPVQVKTFDVIAFSKQDRAAFARVASLMDKARGLLDDADSDADYEMARLEHAAAEFSKLEHIEVEEV